MVAERTAVFSLSSVSFTLSFFEFGPYSEAASLNSTAFFAFKHEFTACGESCSVVSAERRHEFESSQTLCNVKNLHVMLDSSSVLVSFSGEQKRRLCISSSLLFTVDLFSASIEFDVGSNLFESSAILLNVSAEFPALHHGKRGATTLGTSHLPYLIFPRSSSKSFRFAILRAAPKLLFLL